MKRHGRRSMRACRVALFIAINKYVLIRMSGLAAFRELPSMSALLPGWLLLKDHRRPSNSLRLEGNSYLDAVGDPDERDAAVHPVILTVESHGPFNIV
jgi:hypothetical protein